MTNTKTPVALLALALLAGCGIPPAELPVDVDPIEPLVPTALVPEETTRPLAPVVLADSPLETCLAGGGALVEIAAIDNNDQQDHGALLTFGVSPSGMLAAAGEDGTLKFWTLDARLVGSVGSVGGSLVIYGAAFFASPITDIAFLDETAVVSNVSGLVQQMGSDGTSAVLGGTTLAVPIVALAYHAGSARFAHAQMGDVIPLVVQSLDGSSASVEIETTLTDVRDLAFASNGELWVAGSTDGSAAIEIRDASDPSVVVRTLALDGAAEVTEVALSADGAIATAVASDFVYVIRGESVLTIPAAAHAASSVAMTREGEFALSIGADGALVARASIDGRELARADVLRPVTVRIDGTDRLVLVGAEDAIIHAFTCEE